MRRITLLCALLVVFLSFQLTAPTNLSAGAQAHVHRHDPGFRAMAGAQGHGLLAPPDGYPEAGTGPELRGGKRHQEALGRYAPKEIIQHLQDLTSSGSKCGANTVKTKSTTRQCGPTYLI